MSAFVMGAVSILDVLADGIELFVVVVEGIKLRPAELAPAPSPPLALLGSAGIKDEPEDCVGLAAGMKDDLPDEAAALEEPWMLIPFGLTSSS